MEVSRLFSRPRTVSRATLLLGVVVLVEQSLFIQAQQRAAVHPLTGRPIAPTMSVDGADWLERPEREKEERPSKAITAMHLAPGMKVGEIGAGTGYYSLRMAKLVQPGGMVYANDLQPEMLSVLRTKAKQAGITDVVTVQGSSVDPQLPLRGMDIILMVDVYHELTQPAEVLRNVRAELKPDGKLILLEFRKEDPSVPIRPEHEMTVHDVKMELAASGFALDHIDESLPWQHMFFFRLAN